MKKLMLIGFIALMATSCIPTNLTPIAPTSTAVDLNRYLGKWYQIAALPQFFSFNAKCVTAEYSLNQDGSIKVLNKQIGPDGQPVEITGKATVEPNSGNAKLRVGFFGIEPAASNYWIVEIADDYSYAVVSNESKTTWWILSRTTTMEETKVKEIIDRWASYGINMTLLQRTVQDCE